MCNRYRVHFFKKSGFRNSTDHKYIAFSADFHPNQLEFFSKYFDLNETTIFHKENISSLSDSDVS